MKITTQNGLGVKQDIIILGLFEGEKGNYKSFSKELAAELAEQVKQKKFSKKFAEKYSTKIKGKRVCVYGLGKKKEFTLEHLRKIHGKALRHAKCHKVSSIFTNLAELARGKFDDESIGRATAEALVLSNYSFDKYLAKERRDKKKPIQKVSLQWERTTTKLNKGLREGQVIAEAANFSRDLVNEPASVCNSVYMESQARKIAASSKKIKMTVLNYPQMKKLGMGSLLGVNAGSKSPAKLVFLEYKGAKSGKPAAILGKGITFDSGGYNLKPTKYIEDMKTDMGGAAAVMGTIKVAAKLGLKKNLVGVMALCENMVDSNAQRPGDIVKAFNGKTIEIGNTDAEGRLVLADALSYTEKRYQPTVMIDMATLTGACVVALGYYTAAVMGKDENLIKQLKEAGHKSGDRVWPLPFFDDYHDWMDGTISDLNNISQKGKGYEAGSITAGVFLSKFVEKTKWAHIDIAGSAYWMVDNGYMQKGATGSGVRVLSYWLMGY